MARFYICAIFTLFFTITTFESASSSESAKLLELSQSKRTFTINHGIHEGIKEGQLAKFYIDEDYIGLAKAIKVMSAYSYWHLQKPEKKYNQLLQTDHEINFEMNSEQSESESENENENEKEELGYKGFKGTTKDRDRYVHYMTALSTIKDNGDAWSDDMSDFELERFVVNTGLNEEKYRQQEAMKSKINHEIEFLYGASVTDHTRGPLSPSEASAKPYFFSFSYEYMGMKHSEDFRHFSVRANYRHGKNNYYLEEYNINSVSHENLFLLGASYFPWRSPAAVRSLLFYGGGGLGLGQADVSGELNPSDNGTSHLYFYQLALPALWGGIKYRLHEYFGMHVEYLATFLTFKSTTTGVDDFTEVDYKLGAGINYYF